MVTKEIKEEKKGKLGFMTFEISPILDINIKNAFSAKIKKNQKVFNFHEVRQTDSNKKIL